ncbi:MAG TPA: hypothetical protein VFX76_08285, partial [Roseiflexaceae bacterium]|nr:hypothetical protein [Roseiflexaceae bacterium]
FRDAFMVGARWRTGYVLECRFWGGFLCAVHNMQRAQTTKWSRRSSWPLGGVSWGWWVSGLNRLNGALGTGGVGA